MSDLGTQEKSDVTGGVIALIITVVVIFLFIWAIRSLGHYAHSRGTTYCTQYTRAVSIKPTNHDNGKYSDEQYIVTYADGSIDGQDQGKIPFARCTHEIKTTQPRKDGWKTVDTTNNIIDWEQ